MTTDTRPNGIRKAAILVSALSPAAARRLLAQMQPRQAEEVRRVQGRWDRLMPRSSGR